MFLSVNDTAQSYGVTPELRACVARSQTANARIGATTIAPATPRNRSTLNGLSCLLVTLCRQLGVAAGISPSCVKSSTWS